MKQSCAVVAEKTLHCAPSLCGIQGGHYFIYLFILFSKKKGGHLGSEA